MATRKTKDLKLTNDKTAKLMEPIKGLHNTVCSLAESCLRLHAALFETEKKVDELHCSDALSRLTGEVTTLIESIAATRTSAISGSTPTDGPAVPPPAVPGRTYSSVVGAACARASMMNRVVTVGPADGNSEADTAQKVQDALMAAVCPGEAGWRVVSLRPKGRKVCLRMANDEQVGRVVNSSALERAGLVAKAEEKRRPRVLIYDVPRNCTEGEVLARVVSQNFAGSAAFVGAWGELSHFSGPRGSPVRNIVLRVSPNARDELVKAGRVSIGWSTHRVVDFVGVTRCFGCQGYGHIRQHCPKKDVLVCFHCGSDGHLGANCPKRNEPPVCPACKRSNFVSAMDHSYNDKACPSYMMAFRRQVDFTAYNV